MEKDKRCRVVRVESAARLFELTEGFGRDKPLKRIFQIVLCQGCKTILVEEEYSDPDYENEYDAFYRNVFKKYSDKTQRLHFFTCNLRESDIGHLSRIRSKYLGVVHFVSKEVHGKDTSEQDEYAKVDN